MRQGIRLPQARDVQGAIEGLLRVQDAYDLNITQVNFNNLGRLPHFYPTSILMLTYFVSLHKGTSRDLKRIPPSRLMIVTKLGCMPWMLRYTPAQLSLINFFHP